MINGKTLKVFQVIFIMGLFLSSMLASNLKKDEIMINKHLENELNDPDSYKPASFTKLNNRNEGFTVYRHKFRAKNSFNATVKSDDYFFIEKDKVIWITEQVRNRLLSTRWLLSTSSSVGNEFVAHCGISSSFLGKMIKDCQYNDIKDCRYNDIKKNFMRIMIFYISDKKYFDEILSRMPEQDEEVYINIILHPIKMAVLVTEHCK